MEDSGMVSSSLIKNLTGDSDSVPEQFKPIGKEDHSYGGCYVYVADEHDKEITELKILLADLLNSNKERLQKLYDMYKPQNEKMRKCFSHNLNSQPIDGDGYTPLKIETWYFLTKEEARLHLQLDEYLESCSFIKLGNSSIAVFENLMANGDSKLEVFKSLPKDIIMSAVQRRINRLNKIAEHQRFLELVKYLIAQDYKKYGRGFDVLSAHLESENYKVDYNIREDALLFYQSIFRLFSDPTDAGQLKEIWRWLHDYCQGRLRRIMEEWKVKETSGFIYYSAYKELLKEHEKKHYEELERMECCDSSYMDCERWKQEMIAET